MARDDSAALARNWRTILVVDAVIGAVLLVGGVVLWGDSGVVGAVLLVAGLAYLVFDVRRLRRWKRLRSDAGL